MASDPFVRQAVMDGLAANGNKVSGASLAELKAQLGMRDVSNNCFDAAIGSLCYNYGLIGWRRWWDPSDPGAQSRAHVLIVR